MLSKPTPTLEQTFNACDRWPRFRGFPGPRPVTSFRRAEHLQGFIDTAKHEWQLYFAVDGAGPVVFVVGPDPEENAFNRGFMAW
jgi:hypothetical protein